MRRLIPAAWRQGMLIAERFAAGAGLVAMRLPLSLPDGVGQGEDVTLVLLAATGEWRSVRVPRAGMPADPVLAFAGLGDGRGIGIVVLAGAAPAWVKPSRAQVRLMWWSLQGRAPIGVELAVPPGLRIAPGPVEAITVLAGRDTPAPDVMTRLVPVIHAVPPGPGAGPRGPQDAHPEQPDRREAPPAVLSIERFWREGGGCYLLGWMHADDQVVTRATFLQDEGEPVDVTDVHPRPDLLQHLPTLPDGARRAGFAVFLPRQAGSELHLVLETAQGDRRCAMTLPPAEADGSFAWDRPELLDVPSERAWEEFRSAMVDGPLDVLEIGARVVAMGSSDLRPVFAGARRYAGLDIHPAPGLDYVGDAHVLSQVVGRAAFDGIFSLVVLEHLAMPWVAAAEMNRALRPGGLVFHRTHQCWPLHEKPNDFFRYSDEGLRVLFGPVNGFEPLAAGMSTPMSVYPRSKGNLMIDQTGLNPAYGMSWILARKVRELADGAAAMPEEPIERLSRRYPQPPGH